MNEFAADCPFSGLADRERVYVDYIPQNKLVELKSQNYFFISFRNVGIFQEDLTSRKFNDYNPLLEPKELLMKKRYSKRGGIDNTCTINSNEQKF